MSAYLDAIQKMGTQIRGKQEWHAINPEYAVRMIDQIETPQTSGAQRA